MAVAATTRSVPSARPAAASTTPESTPPENATRTPGSGVNCASRAARRESSSDTPAGCHTSAGREPDRHLRGRAGVLDQGEQPTVRVDGGVQAGAAGGGEPLAVG